MSWTPANLGADLDVWLPANGTYWQDSARTTPATADDDLVGAWDDISGNGNHATQVTSDERPPLKLAVRNGLPVLRFGTLLPGSGLSKESMQVPITASSAKAVFGTTIKRNDPGGASLCFFCLDDDGAGNNNFYTLFEATEEYVWKYWNGSGKTPLPGTDSRTWCSMGANYTSTSNVDLYVNTDSAIASANPADDYSTSTVLTIGAYFDGISHQNGDYDILEMVVVKNSLSGADVTNLMNYLLASSAGTTFDAATFQHRPTNIPVRLPRRVSGY